jgi:hypothetical protein
MSPMNVVIRKTNPCVIGYRIAAKAPLSHDGDFRTRCDKVRINFFSGEGESASSSIGLN